MTKAQFPTFHRPGAAGNRRLSGCGGLTRAAAILLFLIFIMLIVTAVPFITQWREESATFNCMLSAEKMQDLVDMEVLFRQRPLTPEETEEFLQNYKDLGEILCPDGGEFDAVDRDSLSMEVVCCRHDSNTGRRARMCAERVLDRVRTEVRKKQLSGTRYPDSVKVTLNSRPLKAVRVTEPTGLRRGTATTPGYKGIVAFYSIAATPQKVSNQGSREELQTGEVYYFSYADENHAVTWTMWDGWRFDGLSPEERVGG